MMSSNRKDYASASEWLSALRKDEAWLSQQQRLQTSTDGDTGVHIDAAMRRIGDRETFEFWEIYRHQVEPVVSEVWEIAELSLPKLKIQTIGMLSMEWLEQHAPTGKQTSKKSKKTTSEKETEKTRELMTLMLSSRASPDIVTLRGRPTRLS